MPLRMGGVEAWITVGDKVPAKEYAVDIDDEAGLATCWISGEPGQVSCGFPSAQKQSQRPLIIE